MASASPFLLHDAAPPRAILPVASEKRPGSAFGASATGSGSSDPSFADTLRQLRQRAPSAADSRQTARRGDHDAKQGEKSEDSGKAADSQKNPDASEEADSKNVKQAGTAEATADNRASDKHSDSSDDDTSLQQAQAAAALPPAALAVAAASAAAATPVGNQTVNSSGFGAAAASAGPAASSLPGSDAAPNTASDHADKPEAAPPKTLPDSSEAGGGKAGPRPAALNMPADKTLEQDANGAHGRTGPAAALPPSVVASQARPDTPAANQTQMGSSTGIVPPAAGSTLPAASVPLPAMVKMQKADAEAPVANTGPLANNIQGDGPPSFSDQMAARMGWQTGQQAGQHAGAAAQNNNQQQSTGQNNAQQQGGNQATNQQNQNSTVPVAGSSTQMANAAAAAVIPMAQAAAAVGTSLPAADPGVADKHGPSLAPDQILAAGSAGAARLSDHSAESAPAAQNSPVADQQELFDQVVAGLRAKLDARSGKAELSLEPPELGRLRVSMSVEHGALTAQFTAASDMVRDLLTQHMDKLRTALESMGIPVDHLAVQSAAQNQNAAAQSGQQSAAGQFAGQFAGNPQHDGRSAGGYSRQPPRQSWGSQASSTAAVKGDAGNGDASLDMVA